MGSGPNSSNIIDFGYFLCQPGHGEIGLFNELAYLCTTVVSPCLFGFRDEFQCLWV